MDIIMNEYTYAENLLNKQDLKACDLGDKPSSTLNLLARYYREIGKNDDEIKELLSDFLNRCLKDKYKESKWIDSIFYQVVKSKKYNLKKVDNVIVTKSEMEIIQSVKGKSRQKVLFTLLVLAKYYNAVSDKNKNWTNLEYKKIFKLANVQLSIQNQALLINDLYNCGFVNVSKNVGKPNIQVNFVDNESDGVLTITRLKDLGKEYLMFCGEDYIRCQKCGSIIKNYKNNNKYCKVCGKYQPIETKTIVCIDCGKEIEIDSRSRKIRCDDCYKLERQEHNRKMYRNRSKI